VTQVVASWEGYLFHNRLTHTLEVAQIARRLGEKLLKEQPDVIEAVGGVDPDVVEAAALAHDLGHPPFGHIAERELDQLLLKEQFLDGFEGNPQSFRTVTKLAIRNADMPGLNLTRATLNAILKYPWVRQPSGFQNRKWGAYHRTEETELRWAREIYPGDDRKSAEAEIMDFADDIAYAVHDVEDFYRAGLIPLDRLVRDESEVDRFLDGTFSNLNRRGEDSPYLKNVCKDAFKELFDFVPVTEPYTGTRQQRASLRSLTAGLISRYISAIKLREPSGLKERRVKIREQAAIELFICKQLTWYYVIDNLALATQQHGQRHIIRELYTIFREASEAKDWDIFPIRYREQLDQLERDGKYEQKEERIRIVADLIAGMTEQQAVAMYQRLTGNSFGTVLDAIVR
jgi:dGTPase